MKNALSAFKIPISVADVGHELADVLYFTLLMCANLDLDATSILEDKLAISAERYPVEKARGRNMKYTELAEIPQ